MSDDEERLNALGTLQRVRISFFDADQCVRALVRISEVRVGIGRGDLVAETGFERVAAAGRIVVALRGAAVPTVWARQVLEDLVKDGLRR